MHASPKKSQLSDLSALHFALECIERGANVAFPFGEHSPYNLIVDKGGKLYRVRAKIAGLEKSSGTLSVNAQKRVPNPSGVSPSTVSLPYLESELDVIAARFHGDWYIFSEPEDLPANIKMAQGSRSLNSAPLEQHKNAWHCIGLT